MVDYLALLGLSLVWFLGVGFGGHRLLALTNRLRPGRQVALWLMSLYSLVMSLLTGLASSIVLSVLAWHSLHAITPGRSNLWFVALVSILPWVTLGAIAALAGTLLTRLDPARQAARAVGELLHQRRATTSSFEGLGVQKVETEIPLALVADGGRKPMLLISTGADAVLTEAEMSAVLWHEYAHAIYQHNGIKRVAATAAALAPKLPLARLMPNAIHGLCEWWADEFALARVSEEDLTSARTKMHF